MGIILYKGAINGYLENTETSEIQGMLGGKLIPQNIPLYLGFLHSEGCSLKNE